MTIIFTYCGDIEKVRSCIHGDKELAVTFADYDDRSALHIACTLGTETHYKIAKLLLENRAKTDRKDVFQHTLMDSAIQGGFEEFVALLEVHNEKRKQEKRNKSKNSSKLMR